MTILVFVGSMLGAMALGMPIAYALLICGIATEAMQAQMRDYGSVMQSAMETAKGFAQSAAETMKEAAQTVADAATHAKDTVTGSGTTA